LQKKLASGKSTILKPQAASQTGGTPPITTDEASPDPLAKCRVIEDVEETGDSIKYLAEDTELHRSVAIRVLPQSSEQQIERAQRRKQTMLLGTAGLGVFFALVFAFFPLFSPAPVAETAVQRFSFSHENVTHSRISPDGKYIVYRTASGGESALWIRPLNSDVPQARRDRGRSRRQLVAGQAVHRLRYRPRTEANLTRRSQPHYPVRVAGDYGQLSVLWSIGES